jgi:heterodisulfide reductase subunit C
MPSQFDARHEGRVTAGYLFFRAEKVRKRRVTMNALVPTKPARYRTFIDEICAYPGGEAVKLCIQCGTCAGSCPNASRMDYPVRELIALARAGERREVLQSNSSWFCLSCYLCTVRCPRGIQPTDFMHALDQIAYREGVASRRTRTPVLYRNFVRLVNGRGMVPELNLMTRFYLQTNPFRAVRMLPIAINLLRHDRLPLRPHHLQKGAQQQLRLILDKARSLEENDEPI